MKQMPPSIHETAFNCPYCDAFSQQYWYSVGVNKTHMLQSELPNINYSYVANNKLKGNKKLKENLLKNFIVLNNEEQRLTSFAVYNLLISECRNCYKISVWRRGQLIYPQSSEAPLANPDLSENIRRDYYEASSILDRSPRGAAALLRLAIQKLCKELEPAGKDLHDAIKKLVAKGLDVHIQQALDVVRVIGNEAVHPGQIDLSDDKETAGTLFSLVNVIAENMISMPKKIGELYGALPEDKLKEIEKRDATLGDT